MNTWCMAEGKWYPVESGEWRRLNPWLGPKVLEIKYDVQILNVIFIFPQLSWLAIYFFFFILLHSNKPERDFKMYGNIKYLFLTLSISSCLLSVDFP